MNFLVLGVYIILKIRRPDTQNNMEEGILFSLATGENNNRILIWDIEKDKTEDKTNGQSFDYFVTYQMVM